MKRIGSRAGDHVDHRSTGKTILSAEVRLLDAEFFHGLGRRRIGHLRDAAVGFVVGDRSAIHQNIRRGIAAAVGDKVGAAAAHALIVSLGDARRQHGQVHHIAIDQRQVVDKFSVNHQAGGRVLCIQRRTLRSDLDGLRGTGDLETQVGGRIFIHIHADAGAHSFLESGYFRGHRIDARRNGAEEIATRVV
jgi:hypothetical protein